MSQTPTTKAANKQLRPMNIALAVAIIVAIVGATWWLGEKNGWADIGTGGTNAQLLPKVGEEAPEFFTLREDGEVMQLSQFRGQAVWINFWGSWCQPCRAEMPDFVKAYDELADQNIVILPVSIGENPEQAIAYRNLVGGNFPVYIDPSFIGAYINAEEQPDLAATFESMRSDWQVRNYPTHVYIDADGIVRKIVLSQMSEQTMLDNATWIIDAGQSLLPQITVERFD